jgi:hypothetical protein
MGAHAGELKGPLGRKAIKGQRMHGMHEVCVHGGLTMSLMRLMHKGTIAPHITQTHTGVGMLYTTGGCPKYGMHWMPQADQH